MSHVSIYDTSVTASAGSGDQNNGPSPYPPVKPEQVLKLQPTQTDFAEYIAGSVETEKAGTLEVQVSFDYPGDHENETDAIEKSHWVIIQAVEEPASEGKYKIEAGKSRSFILFAVAPYFRLVWIQGAITTAEKEAVEKKVKESRKAKEEAEKATWKTEEEAETITRKEREEKEAAQKVALEKAEKEAVEKEAGINEGLRLYARAQEKGRI
jgi:hypothetical protein